MTPSRRSLLAVATVVLLAAGACARSTPVPATTRSYAADTVAIRVATLGGLVPASYYLTNLPEVSVYGDGRVITVDRAANTPATSMPTLLLRHISVDDVRHLVDLGIGAGVGRNDLGQTEIADGPSTSIIILTDTGPRTTHADALGIDTGSGLTASQRRARQHLVDYLNQLRDLSRTLGAGAVDQPQPYLAAAVAAVPQPYEPQPQVPASPAQSWPGPELPGPQVSNLPDLTCVTVTGDQARQVYAAAATAGALTPWSSGGRLWWVGLRPLLPDESSCADLPLT